MTLPGREKEGFLKKFLDKSVFFDIVVIGVLALDAYLLQQNSNTFGSTGITEFPPGSMEMLAAQATVGLIGVKIINALIDSGGDSHR